MKAAIGAPLRRPRIDAVERRELFVGKHLSESTSQSQVPTMPEALQRQRQLLAVAGQRRFRLHHRRHLHHHGEDGQNLAGLRSNGAVIEIEPDILRRTIAMQDHRLTGKGARFAGKNGGDHRIVEVGNLRPGAGDRLP